MATINSVSKNYSDIDRKPRVYFTCHPEDFDSYFQRICDDIFLTHDCTVFYTEDMTEVIPEEDRETDLGRLNLFVVPVTLKLLTTPNRAMDVDIPYARQAHIPILPIMMEPGLDGIYSLPNKFGEMQYLTPSSMDATEIPYPEKLQKHLEAVLISNELAQRIRAAFGAYFFLSYRKKDRRYANELMRLIHSIPECQDIAIWFDEFLTPGESFKENIERILKECKLFTLIVTPRLLEKVVDETGKEHDNYVISTELPLAQKHRQSGSMDILAVEMEHTDQGALSAIGIGAYIRPGDAAFRKRLLDTIRPMAITTRHTPEHHYLMGLAYLSGIDVEVNRQYASNLITMAADAGLPEAMEKLYQMYNAGIGVELDYHKALVWIRKLADYMAAHYGETHPDTLHTFNNLAFTYGRLGNHRQALDLQEKVYTLRCAVLGEKHPDTLTSLNNLAYTYGALGDYHRALKLAKAVYDLLYQVSGPEHPNTLRALNNLSGILGRLGEHRQAMELQKTVYGFLVRMLGEEHPDTLGVLSNLACTHQRSGNHHRALELQKKAYTLHCKVLGPEHPDTLNTLHNLASAYQQCGDCPQGLELQKTVYGLRCKVLGPAHPDTLLALHNLAYTYGRLGNHPQALELQKTVYELRCSIQGPAHPDTLLALHNLAYTYGQLGNCRQELKLEKKVYHLRCKVHGPLHPDTLKALATQAATLYHMGKYRKSLKLLWKEYTLLNQALGESHPLTVASREKIHRVEQALASKKFRFPMKSRKKKDP